MNRCLRRFKLSLNSHSKTMQLSKLTVFVLVLTAGTCRSKIVIGTSKPDESISRFADDLVNIVTSCYEDRIHGIILAGNLPDSLYRKLSVQHLIPVTLVDNIYDHNVSMRYIYVEFRRKLNIFIIEAPTWRKLDTLIVRNLLMTIWWNHMASFFILDLSPGCVNAEDYLNVAWQLNVLDVKVMCAHHKSGRIIFNYNPFTSQAPVPWRQVAVFPVLKHPFTVFSLEYRDNETICAHLDFNKVKDLGDYTIRMEGHPLGGPESIPGKARPGTVEFWSGINNIVGNIFHVLNARGSFNRKTRFKKPATDVDMFKMTAWFDLSWNTKSYILMTYPHDYCERIIITQFRGYKSQLNKILTVIDAESRYCIGIVYLLTLIFLKIFLHQAVVPTLLNLLRITCNTGFANIPVNAASRVYLTSLLFFVITMQGIFQGNWASLLTQNIPLKNANTERDLIDLGFEKIYGVGHFSSILKDPDLLNKFVEVNTLEECCEAVKNDWYAACLGYAQGGYFDYVRQYNLHMSKKPIDMDHLAFTIRWNWPLEQRVNAIISRMVEGEIIQTWYVKTHPILLSDYQVDHEVNMNTDVKIMEFQDLRFAFVILAIGLVCATIVFIIELATEYKCSINCNRFSPTPEFTPIETATKSVSLGLKGASRESASSRDKI